MVCEYLFQVEWYYTMSKACYNCPMDKEDCYRPDCVIGTGVGRPIVTVNRTIPGPLIDVTFEEILEKLKSLQIKYFRCVLVINY